MNIITILCGLMAVVSACLMEKAANNNNIYKMVMYGFFAVIFTLIWKM